MIESAFDRTNPLKLQDLARHLGLSPSTVSKALNGRTDVSLAVRQRVTEAAQALGYEPHPGARSLALGRSATLGVFLLNRFGRPPGEYFGFQFLGGLMAEAQRRGLDLLLFSEPPPGESEDYLAQARRRTLEGLIFIGLCETDPQLERLAQTELPLVSLDTPIPGSRRGFLATDNAGGLQRMLEHHWGQGRRRLAYLGLRGRGYVARQRLAGVRAFWAARAGTPGASLAETEAPLDAAGGYEGARRLLAARPRPEALVCATDLQALGALRAADEAGLRVPQDLALSGFDDLPLAAQLRPRLTTIAQDVETLGSLAVASVLNPQSSSEPILVAPRLIVRESA